VSTSRWRAVTEDASSNDPAPARCNSASPAGPGQSAQRLIPGRGQRGVASLRDNPAPGSLSPCSIRGSSARCFLRDDGVVYVAILRGHPLRCLQHPEHDVRAPDAGGGAFLPSSRRIERVGPQARVSHDGHGYAPHVERFFDDVARGAGHVGHDRPLPLKQRVEERRLARVGLAQIAARSPSRRKTRYWAAARSRAPISSLRNEGAGELGGGEKAMSSPEWSIDACSAREVEQPLAPGARFSRDTAFKLRQARPCRGRGPAHDKRGHRSAARQVNPAVDERAEREFTGPAGRAPRRAHSASICSSMTGLPCAESSTTSWPV